MPMPPSWYHDYLVIRFLCHFVGIFWGLARHVRACIASGSLAENLELLFKLQDKKREVGVRVDQGTIMNNIMNFIKTWTGS
jgi:hypothetical protein